VTVADAAVAVKDRIAVSIAPVTDTQPGYRLGFVAKQVRFSMSRQWLHLATTSCRDADRSRSGTVDAGPHSRRRFAVQLRMLMMMIAKTRLL